jgi:hypothetical protein
VVESNDPLGAKRVGKEERRVGVLVHRRTLVFVLAVAFGLILVFALSRASLADSPNGVPPEPFEDDHVEDACPDFQGRFQESGKVKVIELSDGREIVTAPGVHITLTNVEEPENQITVNFNSAWHFTPLDNDEFLFVATGPLLLRPLLHLLRGRFVARVDSAGEIIEIVSFKGNDIDLCARLA